MDSIKKKIENTNYKIDSRLIDYLFYIHFILYSLYVFLETGFFLYYTAFIISFSIYNFAIKWFKRPNWNKWYIILYNIFFVLILGFVKISIGTENQYVAPIPFVLYFLLIFMQSHRLDTKQTFINYSTIVIIYIITEIFYAKQTNFPMDISYYLVISILFFLFIFFSSMTQKSKVKNLRNILSLNQIKLGIDEDLRIARTVQESLFPKISKIKGLNYCDFRRNHNQIGGDFYDFIRLREGNVGIFLTDVSGHGISSAMVAAIIKVMVSTMPYSMKLHPSSFLDYLDDKLMTDFQSHHATAIYIYIDIQQRNLSIANAGHPYILYSKKNEIFQEIITDGVILGFGIKKPVSNVIQFPYNSGDRIFIYTDGLTESYNEKGKQLDSDGLLKLLNKHKTESNIQSLKEKLNHELNLFYGKNDFIDDAMFLIFELE